MNARSSFKLFITLAFLQISLVKAQTPFLEAGSWNDFEGTLGSRSIRLSIYWHHDSLLTGNYCNPESGKRIPLEGIINGDKVLLYEMSGDDKIALFNGLLYTDNSDQFTGNYRSMDSTLQSEFKLRLESIVSGSSEQRYEDLSATDEQVETFMEKVRSSILNGNKKWIADHVNYPVRVQNGVAKTVLIRTKQQLISEFDKIFTVAFKNKIKPFCTCNLFTNYEGAMLGNGEIWINEIELKGNDSPVLRIIAINN